jgi:hypothetical protein
MIFKKWSKIDYFRFSQFVHENFAQNLYYSKTSLLKCYGIYQIFTLQTKTFDHQNFDRFRPLYEN